MIYQACRDRTNQGKRSGCPGGNQSFAASLIKTIEIGHVPDDRYRSSPAAPHFFVSNAKGKAASGERYSTSNWRTKPLTGTYIAGTATLGREGATSRSAHRSGRCGGNNTALHNCHSRAWLNHSVRTKNCHTRTASAAGTNIPKLNRQGDNSMLSRVRPSLSLSSLFPGSAAGRIDRDWPRRCQVRR